MTAAGPAQPVTRSRLRAALAAHGVAATEQMLADIVAAIQPEATNAVEAYRAAFGKYPAKVFWDSMNQAVGERVQDWQAHCQWWMARGYRPNNYDGLFTSFKEGASMRGNGRGAQLQPRSMTAALAFAAEAGLDVSGGHD